MKGGELKIPRPSSSLAYSKPTENNSSRNNILPERSQCQPCQLKMLNTERNAYNSDAQQQPESQVRKANPNAAQEYPKNIHQHIEATV